MKQKAITTKKARQNGQMKNLWNNFFKEQLYSELQKKKKEDRKLPNILYMFDGFSFVFVFFLIIQQNFSFAVNHLSFCSDSCLLY